jgi:hypothetical protein
MIYHDLSFYCGLFLIRVGPLLKFSPLFSSSLAEYKSFTYTAHVLCRMSNHACSNNKDDNWYKHENERVITKSESDKSFVSSPTSKDILFLLCRE